MFCKECGANIADDSKFCRVCGASVSEELREIATSDEKTAATEKKASEDVAKTPDVDKPEAISEPINEEATKKEPEAKVALGNAQKSFKFGKATISIILAAIVAFIAIAVLAIYFITRPVKVNLNDYVKISWDGYDGYGIAMRDFDYGAFRRDYGEKLKVNMKRVEAYNDPFLYAAMQNTPATDTLVEFMTGGQIDKTSGLSNGDTIKFVWKCSDQEAKEMYNCELIYSDLEYTISDLKPVEKYDAFDGVTAVFEGIDGDGVVSVEGFKGEESISIDKKTGLSNGDKITVSINIGDIEQYINRYGRAPEEVSKQFTVEGLGKVRLEAADISDDFIASINTAARSEIESSISYLCRAKDKKLVNNDEIKLSWGLNGEVTADPKLIQIDVGNSRSSIGNMMLLLYEVPYKAYVAENGWDGTDIGKTVAEGTADIVIEYDNAVIYSDSDFYIGDYINYGIRESVDELKQVCNKFKDGFEFFSVDTKDIVASSDNGNDSAAATTEEVSVEDVDDKLISFAKDTASKASKNEDLEYLLIDMNGDGINEMLLRSDGYLISSVYCFKNNKIEEISLRNAESSVYTYLNSKKQYVADKSNEIDCYQYDISEIDSSGKEKSVLFLLGDYNQFTDSWKYYKAENPPEFITTDDCQEISEADFNKLRSEYANEDTSIKWQNAR